MKQIDVISVTAEFHALFKKSTLELSGLFGVSQNTINIYKKRLSKGEITPKTMQRWLDKLRAGTLYRNYRKAKQ